MDAIIDTDQAPIGFRAWRITSDLSLRAMFVDYVWDHEKPTHSSCSQEAHMSPAFECNCGLNCFYSLPSDKDLLKSRPSFIWGAVAGRGKTFLHKIGARFEEAQILSLYVPEGYLENYPKTEKEYLRIVGKISQKYRVQLYRNQEDMVDALSGYGKLSDKKPIKRSQVISSTSRKLFVQSKFNPLLDSDWERLLHEFKQKEAGNFKAPKPRYTIPGAIQEIKDILLGDYTDDNGQDIDADEARLKVARAKANLAQAQLDLSEAELIFALKKSE